MKLIIAGMVLGLVLARAGDRPAADKAVTYNRDIAPLLFQNCSTCHRPGEVAPFTLLNYGDAKKRAKQIADVTGKRFMPPWKSVEGHGQFIGERRLSKAAIELISTWVEQGAVEGDPKDLPELPKFSDGWKLGLPDMVIAMPQPYQIPADGPDIYRNFVFEVKIPNGKYIKAVEYRPGNRQVVHHAAVAFDTTNHSRTQDEADPEPGFKGSLNIPGRLFPGSMSAWTPGRDAMPLPTGLSMPWKAGADLILQLHIHPLGKPSEERSEVGIFLTDEPPKRSMADVVLINKKIDIAPGESAYRTHDELVLPIDVEAFGLFPHMHLIGREMKVTAYPPQGEEIPLLWINDWDFNWQNFYQYSTPVKLVAGTKIVMDAVHDNSASNPRNPNQPPQRVTWGEQTANEMSAAILQLVPKEESELPKLMKAHGRRIVGGITVPKPAAQAPKPQASSGVNATKLAEN